MNAMPMILKCAGNSRELSGATFELVAMGAALITNRPHPDQECRMLRTSPNGPNLVLWTGGRHALVLDLK